MSKNHVSELIAVAFLFSGHQMWGSYCQGYSHLKHVISPLRWNVDIKGGGGIRERVGGIKDHREERG